jgi:hypothetical protein
MDEEKDKGGRPTEYKEEYNELAYKLCLLGHTDAELAAFFEVTKATINNWKKEKEGFFDSLTRGKVLADANVVEAMYNRAIGVEVKEKRIKTDSDGGEEITITTKEIPADVGAQKNWIANRQRSKWRLNPDNQEDEKEGNTGSLTINIGTNGIKELPSHEDDIIDFTENE